MKRAIRVCFLYGSLFIAWTLSSTAQTSYLCGDVNNDGKVDVEDLNYLIRYVKFAGPPPVDVTKADVNVSSAVDTSDIAYLANYLFFGGPAPLCYPSFHPASDTTVAKGTYWYYDFIIPPHVTVTFQDSVTLNVLAHFLIDTTGTFKANCIPVVINHLSQYKPLELLGNFDDTCTSPNPNPGRVVIRSAGNIVMGGNMTGPQGLFAVSGTTFVGDPWYAAPKVQDTAVFFGTNEDSSNIAPVCNLKMNYTTSTIAQFSFIIKDLPLGSSVSTVLYFGDGDSVINPSSPVSHTYLSNGQYLPYLRVIGGSDTSRASLSLRVPGERFQGSLSPFTGDSLIKPAGASFQFTADVSTNDSLLWDFNDGDTSRSLAPVHTFDTPGGKDIFLVCYRHDSIFVSQMSIYVKFDGSETTISYPVAPSDIFPNMSTLMTPQELKQGAERGPLSVEGHSTHCPECAQYCSGSFTPPPGAVTSGGLTVFGNLRYRLIGPYTYGATNATIILNGVAPAGPTGSPPVTPGHRGLDGNSCILASLAGTMVLCNSSFSAGSGGNGVDDNDIGGCDAFAKGGHGGNAGSLGFLSPQGKIVFCGTTTISLGNGGDGGNANAVGANGLPCKNGCNAFSKGGRGGTGGGGIVYLTQSACYDSAYRIVYTGTAFGGDGGNSTATGGNGGNCADCKFVAAGKGGNAFAEVGKHGLCYIWFATSRDKLPADVQNTILKHISSSATCFGGFDGLVTTANGGNGGAAIGVWLIPVNGGDGGSGWVKLDRHPDPGATTGGTGGNGGNAGGGASQPGKKGSGGILYSLRPQGMFITHGTDGQDGPVRPPYVGYADLSSGPFCVTPPSCRDSLKIYSDTSTFSLMYGKTFARFCDPTEFQSFTGGGLVATQYQKSGSTIGFLPGAVVFVLDSAINGGVISGMNGIFQATAGANTIHLVGYQGGTPVAQASNSGNGLTSLQISYPGPGKLDSIVVWGTNFLAQLWGSKMQYRDAGAGQEPLSPLEMSPIERRKY